MARCPTCKSEITHVDAEMIELNPSTEVESETEEPSQAIATVCPECNAIIGI
ncbi:hypothetical protein [Halodesulfurarchaeum sp.]|uniref:hypothetical protein n=1 Tax=Halodesulfurarchaeum sp. TaxID=1980530 RepID=UPI001BC711CB|nr:hypothetical protein [Halodesulfurarchaeum sp.]